MKTSQLLYGGEAKLSQAAIKSAHLDSLLLLETASRQPREKILSNLGDAVDEVVQCAYEVMLAQRLVYKPIAHIVGWREFYGRNFRVIPPVLVPRPESETMIDELKKLPLGNSARVIDVGCGSGVLGITAALELPSSVITLVDNDDVALKNTRINVDLFTLTASVVKSDLLSGFSGACDVVLANLPYVPDDYPLNRDARHEAPQAIYGGPDGLNVYRRLFAQINHSTQKPLYILCESFEEQQPTLAALAAQCNYRVVTVSGLIETFKLANN